jgi:hypothetical protein
MDLRFEDEAFGVYEQMPLCALELLGPVLTSLFSAHRGALERLGVHRARAGLGIPPQADPEAFSDSSVDPLAGAFSKRQVLK